MSLLLGENPFGEIIPFPGFHPGLPIFLPYGAGDLENGGIMGGEEEATNTHPSALHGKTSGSCTVTRKTVTWYFQIRRKPDCRAKYPFRSVF
jgi:hypothetical protein